MIAGVWPLTVDRWPLAAGHAGRLGVVACRREGAISIRITNVLGINSINSNAGCVLLDMSAVDAGRRVNCNSETQGKRAGQGPRERPGRGTSRLSCLACLISASVPLLCALIGPCAMRDPRPPGGQAPGRSAAAADACCVGALAAGEWQMADRGRVWNPNSTVSLFCLRTCVPRASACASCLACLCASQHHSQGTSRSHPGGRVACLTARHDTSSAEQQPTTSCAQHVTTGPSAALPPAAQPDVGRRGPAISWYRRLQEATHERHTS